MAKLVVTIDGAQQELELGDEIVEVGRDAGCAITIQDPHSSRHHCRVQPTESGFELVDLGSSNGTLHNGARVERVPLLPGDRIQIGEVRIEFIAEPGAGTSTPTDDPDLLELEDEVAPPVTVEETDGPVLIVASGPLEGKRLPLQVPFSIGRNAGCDLVLSDRKVSGEHARIERQGDRFVIEDLGSGNGLFVGRNKVKKHRLLDGDLLVVGDTRLRVRGLPQDPAMDESSSASRVFRAVDEGEITEDDLSRLRVRPEEAASSLQGLYTGGFVVCFGLILYYGYSMISGVLAGAGAAADPDNLLGPSASFERAPESGWSEEWNVDTEMGDGASLESLREEGVPQGRGALRITSSGGDHGRVRIRESREHEIGASDAFLVAGQVRSVGFDRVGLVITWYTRRGGDLYAIDESYTALSSRNGWSRLSAIIAPPRFGDPQACRLGVLALGRGSLDLDDLVLKKVPREETEPLGVEVRAGGVPLRATLDERGVIQIVRDNDRWLRQLRFARIDEQPIPWGQLLPERNERPSPVANGAIRNNFQVNSGGKNVLVSQVTQVVGDQIKVGWTPDLAAGAMLVIELDRAIEAEPVTLFSGERIVAQNAAWSAVDGEIADEVILGDGANQLIVRLGTPGRIGLLDREGSRGGSAFTWSTTIAMRGGVLECFLGTVSDRERHRVDELWNSVVTSRDEGQEGKALKHLADLEREFPWREDVVERVRRERVEIEERAEAGWRELLAIRSDLRELPGTPIAGVLVDRAEEFAQRFTGTARAREAASLARETRDRTGTRQAAKEREFATELLEVANGYYEANRDRVARFYYQWLCREHPDSDEARTAAHRLEMIEARRGS